MNSPETSRLTRGLDYYKATMSQVEFANIPDEIVTFALKNRSPSLLSDYCSPDELRTRLNDLRAGWQPEEVAYLASLTQQTDGQTAMFNPAFLDYLMDNSLPDVEITLDERGDLAVRATGPAPLVTFWETVIMSEINEIYFRNLLIAQGRTLSNIYEEGNRRLDDKIARLRERPDIKFSDFGTRRRFSYDWQRHVVARVAQELPDNFLGTSNIALAHELGLAPIGTFAHELPMIYAALADTGKTTPLLGHGAMLRDWRATYGDNLSTALTDTFGSEFFFTDFTPEQAHDWKALRHDSGDPIVFGDRVIEFYQQLGIDPTTKTIVFSDGLDIDTIIKLADYFKDRVSVIFGWGTTLTNDLGLKANNFVMKAVAVGETPTVKLSDVAGKHTGPEAVVARYERDVAYARSLGAVGWQRYCADLLAKRQEKLWHVGANKAADAVIINGNRVRLIWRAKDQCWALPGGFVNEGEDSRTAAIREAYEETGFVAEADGDVVYSGRVDDPRNSGDRWIETDAYVFLTGQEDGQAGDDAADICWAPLDNLPPLYGSHREIIARAVSALVSQQVLQAREDQGYVGIFSGTAHPRTA